MVTAQLASQAEELVRQDEFSGTVLVAKGEEPIFEQAYGYAYQGYQIRNQMNTKYNIGSCTKMFTALAILQFVQEGKINLHDPVSRYLPDYPREIAEKVTVHHLLTHTSGLVGSVLNEKTFAFYKDKVRTTSDWLVPVMESPLLFEPGAAWSYSNAGYVVLAAIIEQVSSLAFFDYLHEKIWVPLGMHDTTAQGLDEDVPHRAMGYMNREENESLRTPRRNHLPFALIRGNGHSGAWSTVRDLLCFGNALRHSTLLDRSHTDILLHPKVVTGRKEGEEGERYAYGFFVEDAYRHRIIGHGGIVAGFNARFEVYIDLNLIVVILSNYSFPAAERLGETVRELIFKG